MAANGELLLNAEHVIREFDKSRRQNGARLDQLKAERAITEAQIREHERRRDELTILIAQTTGVIQAETEWMRVFASAQQSQAQQSQAPGGESDAN